jgi:hypothetical protein
MHGQNPSGLSRFVPPHAHSVDDLPPDFVQRVINGGSNDNAFVSAVGSPLSLSTTLQTFVTAGVSVTIPVTGTYWMLLEGEGNRATANPNVYLEVNFSTTTRQYWLDVDIRNRAIVASGIGSFLAGQVVDPLFRKASVAVATISFVRRRFTAIKVN